MQKGGVFYSVCSIPFYFSKALMEAFKTYENVNRADESLSFGISTTEEIFEKHQGKPDAPHRHNFYTVIIALKAKGKHVIDFHEFALGENQVFFLSPGQVHQMKEESPTVGYSMVFSSQFLVENNIPLNFIKDLNLFNDFGETPPLLLNPKEMQRVKAYAEEILELQKSVVEFKYEAIGSLLKLLLIRCNNICALLQDFNPTIDGKNATLSKFKDLINRHHRTWHATSDYAEELHITPDYLNRIVKSATGKTAKEHIQSRIIVAAKRMLYFSELSQKEIGFELGFSEPANFSAFFKKCVGLSPSQFRANN